MCGNVQTLCGEGLILIQLTNREIRFTGSMHLGLVAPGSAKRPPGKPNLFFYGKKMNIPLRIKIYQSMLKANYYTGNRDGAYRALHKWNAIKPELTKEQVASMETKMGLR